MLNNSTRNAADKVRDEFFEFYPNVNCVDTFDDIPIARILMPTGLQNVKAKRIINMSLMYSMVSEDEANSLVQSMTMPGVGEYARDSWNIFVNHNYDVKPSDKELILYLEGHYGGPGGPPTITHKVSIK
jgi:endonuclease III